MLHFAPATPADLPALNRLVNRAYRGEASTQGWTTEAALLAGQRTDEADLREQLEKPAAQFLLARRPPDDELIGSVFLQHQGPELYLGMLSVEPTLQAGGVGRQLVQAAESHARNLGCTAVRMTVISVRHELLAWYERLGYQRTSETVAFPTDTRFGVPLQAAPLVLMVLRKEMEK
ncbi:GNAT family N-acetyltransferase [Hymenobacter psychrophilus]|uniref:Predicted N-acetyltransferase YhbS n=1 Tax=Hymenobacter psychrophilus TaxID=651662 RepID=A0A1H3LPJ6_9BACT|nr:GNAT family N-acetyltransferase [Hymenobacter psychrophilus]SDY66331.1 Predicted N-acetyltransferase YhbS [Hymenobacter psychrophilus]